MKNTIITACLILLAVSQIHAQAPNLLPWQGAFRDKDDQPQNGVLDLRFRLLRGSATSTTIAFEEINNNVPVKLGVASHVLGSINTAEFAAIDWSNGPYFLEVARFKGGSTPEVVGTPEQLKSVPYALEAGGLDLPFDGSAQNDNVSGFTIRNSGNAIWGRTTGVDNTSGIVGECTTTNNGIGVRASHAIGTWAHLATPTNAADFNGNIQSNNGKLTVNNAGGYIQASIEPNAGLELHGGTPYIDFAQDVNTDFNARLIVQGDKKFAYESPGGHVFYAGNGRVQVVGNGQQSAIDIITPSGLGFLGFNGSGSFQIQGPGHVDYVSQGGGNHNFYGGAVIASGKASGTATFAFYARNPSTGGPSTGGPINNGSVNYAIYASDRILGVEFDAFSDARIKNIVGQSDAVSDLSTLSRLKVTDYTHKDIAARGTASKKGFIAQEVEQIFPEAVSKSKDFIPNIYQVASSIAYDNPAKTLTLTMNKPTDLKTGDRVRLIADKQYEVEVSAVVGNTFTVKDWTALDTKEVFVFGKEVSDFRTVDYDRIFTLNVSATQELTKQVADLKKQLADREAQFNDALSMLQTLHQEVVSLKTASVTTQETGSAGK